jgi:hypothetical protein
MFEQWLRHLILYFAEDKEKKTRTNKKYLVKCALGGELTIDNNDDTA